MGGAPLTDTARLVIDKHISESGMQSGVRVVQWEGALSVYFANTGRLWVHNTKPRKQGLQELQFYSVDSSVGTLTCGHRIKLWDRRRYLTVRETARVQGFPEDMVLPETRFNRLFGNAVCVRCAAFALSTVVDEGEAVRHLDLCAGIGGFSFALREVAPASTTVGFSEIMPAAVQCYRANFPDVPGLGDATARDRTWPTCDLVTAGFPCQPFSNCNSEERRVAHKSRDFFETVLDVVGKTGADRVVLENVPNIRANGDGRFERLLACLREAGFYVDYAVLDSKDSHVPQQRRRIYIVARKGTPPRPLSRPSLPPTLLRTILEDP